MEYSEIKKQIKDSQRLVFWYNTNNKLLYVSSSKSKNEIKDINYDGLLYRLNISFHSGQKIGQGGPISITSRIFRKENKKITKINNDGNPSNKNGVIWFDKKWLERKGEWNEKWLDMIVKKLNNKFQFKIGIYLFTDLF